MSVEQFVAILGGIASVLLALAAVFAQVRQTHQLVNSRLTDLLEVTAQAATARGVLEGRASARADPPV